MENSNNRYKFRVWDKNDNRMWNDVQDCYDFMGGEESNNGENIPASSFGQFLNNDLYEVMQFTGHKDTNGKDIFENDVVINQKINEKRWQVIYRTDSEYVGFVLEEIGKHDISLFTSWNDIEVIGNVWDNPELLELKQ